MADEFPADFTGGEVQQSRLQPAPELTPEELSGKLTPHPPSSKPTGRPHRLASAASKDLIPEELPISQDEDQHTPPEVEEKLEARAETPPRAEENLVAPPEEVEEEQSQDDSKGSVAAIARHGAAAEGGGQDAVAAARDDVREVDSEEQKLKSATPSKPVTRQDDTLPKIVDNRLPKLVDEIEEHLKQKAAKPPLDGSGWLAELGQLELFAEELRWLINQREDSRVNSSNSGNARGRAPRNASARSNDDLQRALQHLRSAEIEHARLSQRLHTDDPRIHQERMAELQQVEKDLLFEKRRLLQLNKESHLRDLKLARAAKRARLGEFGAIGQGNGTLRVLKQTEWAQAEADVWKVKNGLLEKQIREQEERLAKAQQGFESLATKRQALEAKLESDTVQNWMAGKKHREDMLKKEGNALRAEVHQLQERRRKKAQATKHTLRSRSRRLADLRSQQASLETDLIKLKNAELRLLKTLKQQDERAVARAKAQKEAEEAAMLALQEAEEATAQALAACTTMLPDSPLQSQAGELQQVDTNIFDLTVVDNVLESAYKMAGSAAIHRQDEPTDDAETEALRRHVRNLLMVSAEDGTLFGELSDGVLAVGSDQCPNCGNIYAIDAAFCRKCGRKRDKAPLPSVALQPALGALSPAELQRRSESESCPNCGNIYAFDARFCRKCGRKRKCPAEEVSSEGSPSTPQLASGPPGAVELERCAQAKQLTRNVLYGALHDGELEPSLQAVFDEDEHFRELAATRIQAIHRGNMARAQLSEAAAKKAAEEDEQVREKAATKIQAVHRGNMARAQLSDEL
eukprot:TRINITY_DN1570_c0_g1_i2.p1 TRINITY_DN1570_c0_g1~~TRINITY_DN1570_c0_g1_i2.p1  ORF type:complete len:805 (-),score=211.84 TRINITY_DN1570_c0_g1_i2:79-2493(-)